MSVILRFILSALAIASAVEVRAESADFSFRGVEYFHRWSGDEQHEFTPAKQENLERWAEMITVDGYPDAHDGDALAAKANAVLENYKNHQATVLRTMSVPRTRERPAEHLIAVLFARPAFSEVAFARFKLVDGEGCSVVFSHRIYGEKSSTQMREWIKANGPALEKALLDWHPLPSAISLRQSARRTES